MHTLNIEHAVLLGLVTVSTVANSLPHRGIKGVDWFLLIRSAPLLGAVPMKQLGNQVLVH